MQNFLGVADSKRESIGTVERNVISRDPQLSGKKIRDLLFRGFSVSESGALGGTRSI
jgi:hypothetical protein